MSDFELPPLPPYFNLLPSDGQELVRAYARAAIEAYKASQAQPVGDAAIKAVYVQHFGSDAGWLAPEGSMFTEGFTCGRRHAAPPAQIDRERVADAVIAELERRLSAQIDRERVAELEQALRELRRGYVIALENGRDRIVFLGGDCDPLDVMIESDPYLRKTAALLTKLTEGR